MRLRELFFIEETLKHEHTVEDEKRKKKIENYGISFFCKFGIVIWTLGMWSIESKYNFRLFKGVKMIHIHYRGLAPWMCDYILRVVSWRSIREKNVQECIRTTISRWQTHEYGNVPIWLSENLEIVFALDAPFVGGHLLFVWKNISIPISNWL